MSLINNIPALQSQRQLGIININISKTIQRLSTGLRINSAADDAAGLAISERLRSQIATLAQGTINAQDAISVAQVAEGGLDSGTQILQRIRVLATTAASATRSDSDRALLQVEVNELFDELGRIAQSTKFGDKILLNGSIAASENGIASATSINSNAFVGAQSTALVASVSVVANSSFSLSSAVFQLKVVTGAAAGEFSVYAFSSLSTATEINGGVPLAQASLGTEALSMKLLTIGVAAGAGISIVVGLNNQGLSTNPNNDLVGKVAFISTTAAQLTSTTDKSLYIQVGADTGEVIKVFAPSLLPTDLFFSQNVKLDTFLQAEGLLNQVGQALDRVNRSRAQIGAQQNRFENSIRNNNIYHENLTASESRIRDLDVAKETTNFTKNQILLQSSTAFLAQANLIPQSLLQLLK